MTCNVLVDDVIHAVCGDATHVLSLPALFAALMADSVDALPHLRSHQQPAWHAFLVQLGALACHRGGLTEPPTSSGQWQAVLRGLTPDYPNDEPWCLVVDTPTRPAFLQPPVPDSVELGRHVPTPDALDMLITARNHDVKQAIAFDAAPDDWIFALVNQQTCGAWGGQQNYGIARMNGGSSSRFHFGVAPMVADNADIRCGLRIRRDITKLLARRAAHLEQYQYFKPDDGLALVWLADWPVERQLMLTDLDIWFIEVCRRVRLQMSNGRLSALVGGSKKSRIEASSFKGNVGDPWAPFDKINNKALTLGEQGVIDYRLVTRLLGKDWQLPILARVDDDEPHQNWQVVLQAFAHGNCKIRAFWERVIPVTGPVLAATWNDPQTLHSCAKAQVDDITSVDKMLGQALALAYAGGDHKRVGKSHYTLTYPIRAQLRHEADQLFFRHLDERYKHAQSPAGRHEARHAFLNELIAKAKGLLEQGLAGMRCPQIYRHRAIARSHAMFAAKRRKLLAEDDASAKEAASQ